MSQALAIRIALSVGVALGAIGCKEEGPAEKAGRKLDEAVEKLRHGDEGAIERAGRELDEAIDDLEDEIDDLRDKAAEAIEAD